MEEYTRFPTMGETIFEFVEAVSFRTEQGRHNLFVLMSDLSNNTVSLHPPLILLDGIPLLDPEQIYRYDPALVERMLLGNRRGHRPRRDTPFGPHLSAC